MRKGQKTGKRIRWTVIGDMPESTEREKSQLWLRKCDLKIPSKALLCSAQEQAIRTNSSKVKYHIEKSVDSPSCRDRRNSQSYRELTLKTNPEGIQKKTCQNGLLEIV